jgi:hypothetical protein
VRRAIVAGVLLLLASGRAAADLSQPALLDLTETAPGRYEVVFKLPRLGTRVLALRPVLPPVFRALSEPTYEIVQGAQVARWTVEADPWSLGGQRVEIEGLGASISDTVVRFRFRDGTVVTRILLPESPSCEIPEPTAAGDATAVESRRLARAIRGAVLEGLRHAASSVPHLLLVLALALAVPGRAVLRPLTGFAAGHAVGILLGTGLGLTLRLAPSEALLGVAAAIAARAAWRGEGAGLTAVAAIGGAVHGVALASGATLGTGALLAATLGVDAVQLLVGLGLAGLVSLVPRASLLAWPTGVAGVLVALLAATATHVPARDPAAPLFATAAAAVTAGSGPSSVPLTAAGSEAVSVFLSVEPFETRLQAILRLGAVAPGTEVVTVAEQEAVLTDLEARLRERVTLSLDGVAGDPAVRRIEFVTRSEVGVLERSSPVPERREEALVGVTWSWPGAGIPDEALLRWELFAGEEPVPATLVDPERTRSLELRPEAPDLAWRNELRTDPLPRIEAVALRDPVVEVSLLSIGLALLALGIGVARRGRGILGLATPRLLLAGACFLLPFLPVSVPRPSAAIPTAKEAKSITGALLTNVYRAFEHRDEEAVYERLAVSVTGEQLRSVYLTQRRTLELERQGGARARTDSVELVSVGEPEAAEDGGFRAQAEWEVSGTVIHYGHRHLRRNRYRATVVVVPVEGTWKLGALAVREQERIR